MGTAILNSIDAPVYPSQQHPFPEDFHRFWCITIKITAEKNRIPVITESQLRFQIWTPGVLDLLVVGWIVKKRFYLTLVSVHVGNSTFLCHWFSPQYA